MPIDKEIGEKILNEKERFTEDHFILFESLDDFLSNGFGYVILKGEKIVSIASSFLVCNKGIEIQINTNPKFEGRGLGTVVGAALIDASLEKGLDPNWDAATKTSAHIAKKFGYVDQGTYPMYIIFGSKILVGFLLMLKKIRNLFVK